TGEVQVFTIDSVQTGETGWQRMQTTTLFGRYETVTKTLAAGTTVTVDMSQSLARLVFYLLEPRSDDGLVTWNLLEGALGDGAYPIVRSMTPVRAP
ncbi:MAG: peptidase M14, partial [Gemmatimonadetes bacterium]|nr:peptidase M14 [Gemmatimonadota bacterium]